MAPLADNQQLSFECPGCSARITVTAAWLKSHQFLSCHTCPAVLNTKDLLAAASETARRRRAAGKEATPVMRVKLSL